MFAFFEYMIIHIFVYIKNAETFIMTAKFFTILFLSCLSVSLYAQRGCPNPASSTMRVLAPGTGPTQSFDRAKDFTCSTCFHFVQFGVYKGTTDKYSIQAPEGIPEIWLIKHDHTLINGQMGAMYMVKAFGTESQARSFATSQKNRGIPCWYNPSLTGADFELLSVAQ